MCVCDALYEIYPKTARTEIIFETDGTAAVFRELLVDKAREIEGTLKCKSKYCSVKTLPRPFEMGKLFAMTTSSQMQVCGEC